MQAIKCEKLTKKYKDLIAVNAIDLEVEENEIFSLLGVNGAGKTTTIKMLSCLTKPTSGNAYIFGNSIINESNKVKELIGVSPQETAIAPNLTVKENLEFMCELYKFNKEKKQAKVNEMLNDLGLREFTNKKAGKLSGGWKRRLSIALAIISEPKLLFLDEPTLGLDVLARNELWEKIETLKGKMTIILTTHYMEEAEALSDRVAIMYNGNIIKVGSVQDLLEATNTSRLEDAFVHIIKESSNK